jgi:hypothetical protein
VRIARHLQGGVFRGRAHRELVEVHAAKGNRSGGAQALGDRGVVGRGVAALQKAGAAGAGLAQHIDVVLQRDRDSPQRQAQVGGGGLDFRGLQVKGQIGPDLRVAGQDGV